jgi:hypothetical protein
MAPVRATSFHGWRSQSVPKWLGSIFRALEKRNIELQYSRRTGGEPPQNRTGLVNAMLDILPSLDVSVGHQTNLHKQFEKLLNRGQIRDCTVYADDLPQARLADMEKRIITLAVKLQAAEARAEVAEARAEVAEAGSAAAHAAVAEARAEAQAEVAEARAEAQAEVAEARAEAQAEVAEARAEAHRLQWPKWPKRGPRHRLQWPKRGPRHRPRCGRY